MQTRPCPMCKKIVEWDNNPWRPFCSERCKMTDLGYWAMGVYKVPVEEQESELEEETDEGKVKSETKNS